MRVAARAVTQTLSIQTLSTELNPTLALLLALALTLTLALTRLRVRPRLLARGLRRSGLMRARCPESAQETPNPNPIPYTLYPIPWP